MVLTSHRPKIVTSPNILRNLLKNSECLKQDILVLHNLYNTNKLPDYIKMIGLAMNYMLGVFVVKYNIDEDSYECYRIASDNGNLIIANVHYPVTNMKHSECVIECNIDYLTDIKTISNM